MSDPLFLTLMLGAATFCVRYLGVILGQRLPTSGPWNRALTALPGCLIVSLVAVILLNGDTTQWIGAFVALMMAIVTANLPLTMVAGIITVWYLRM